MTRTRAAIAATIALLLGYELLRTFALPDGTHAVANLVAAAGVYALARWGGVSDDDLGLTAWGRGLRWGGAVFAAIAAVLAVGSLVPATRGAFEDASAPDGVGSLLVEVLVAIPLGTVVLEELAFRGSLLALFRSAWSTRVAVVASSVLFGLWHVIPEVWDPNPGGGSAALASSGLTATLPLIVLATAGAGLAFCWLRLRSGSLVAPFLAHVATNSVSVLVVWLLAR